ncbi:hypothetical protein E8L90_20155 [Brevibacillus antibioticus]|uniref:Uncharacterized protein n=1 Tax=Brevibacillus antibioticus TaxID=2570228 RepID=A0A4U2YC26_9BACL|nr:hypothetical protein E8L90_20155 [Brevibacillus antibioticus]
MSQHSGGEEKAQVSSTLTRQHHGGFTVRLHFKKMTVEPKPPYGRLRALCFFFLPAYVYFPSQ